MKFGHITKILLIGGGNLLLPLGEWCRTEGIEFAVYTSPRHAEEIQGEDSDSLREALEKNGIDVHVRDNINDDSELSNLVSQNTLGLAVGPAWIFHQPVLDLFQGRIVNFHSIPLPRYRGGAHFTWQILQRDRTGGLNIQLIERKLDAGAVIMRESYSVPDGARKPIDYFTALDEHALPFLQQFVDRVLAEDEFAETQLQEEFSLYMPRLNTVEQAFIDWSWSGDEILRFVDAFDNPYPGAATLLNGEIVRLKTCELDPSDGVFHSFQSGLIVRKSNHRIYVATSQGTLIVSSLTNESGDDQIQGARVGDRLHTPTDAMDAAMTFQAKYDAHGARN